MSFKVGDVVKLKSGGPLMTVTGKSTGPDRPALFTCAWFDKEHREHTSAYPADALNPSQTLAKGLAKLQTTANARRGGGSSEGGTGWMR